MKILKHYWRSHPYLPVHLMQALETGVNIAVQASANKIDHALLRALIAQGLDAKPREKILSSRRFEDDIRVYAGDDELSIEVENDGNRLEFDLLKMMSFAEGIPKTRRAWGCLIIPATKSLGNPFISGNGKERIWEYLTRRLLPMIVPIQGLRIANILVLGFERMVQTEATKLILPTHERYNEEKLRGLVERAWIRAGKPSWNIDRTLKEAIAADARLERNGNGDPAPKFRTNRAENNLGYLRQWVGGCKFSWLRNR